MEFPSALSVVDPRGVGSAPIDPAQRYAVYQRTVLQVLGATVAALSVVFSLFTLYWFMKVKSSFRHRLVMLLINGDMVKAFSFLLFPVVYLSGAPIERSSGLCQAIGFFTQLGTEAADIAVLIIALHTALYIFRPPASLREGGVYPYRKFVYSAWVIFPLTMASLAFVNPDDGYASQGAFCSLPIRPFWYRLALAWIPRYIILGVIIGIYVAIYVFVQCKFHGIESTLSTGSMEERLSLPRAKVPQPTKERSTSTHVACTIERFQFLGIPDLAVNGLAPSRLTSSVEVNPWDEDIASTNYDPFITRAESAGISGDGTSNDLPKTDGHKEVWQTLGPRYPRMSSGSSFLPFDRLRTSGYLKTPGFFRAKYMPKTPSSGPEVVRQKAQDPLTDIDITDFDKEVWEMSNSSLPGERQETPSVLAKVDTADIPLPDVTDFDKGVCEIPDSSLLVECQETPSAWTKADTADMPLPELTEFDKGVGEMPESSLPGKVQDKSVFAKVDTADMPLPDTTDFDKKVLEISDSTLQGKLLDESVSAKVDTADMPLQDTTDFDKKVLEMSDSSLPGKLQDKSALPKVDTADMPFSHITDSDKQVLEMSDSTVPGKVQDKTVLPKVDTADMPLPDTTDFDKKVLEMSDSTLPGKLQDNSALPKVDTTDTSLPELAIPNQHERKRSSVSIQLPPTQPAPVYLNLDPVHRYGTIWNAPDPYDNAAKDKLRQDRRRVRHQLRLLFIYPLVYALMWVLPFAYHCLLYSDTYAKKPPFVLNCLSVVSFAGHGIVDSWFFIAREKPWRSVPFGKLFACTTPRRPTTPAPTTAAAVRRPSLQKDYLSVDARQAYRRREAELADAVELQTLQRLARPASAKTTGKDWWEVTGGGEGDVEVGGANAA